MPKLRSLSGGDVVAIFKSFGFEIEKQRGSHVKLFRRARNGKQVLGVPFHDDLDKGTLKAIYNQARGYIPEDELRKNFYTE